MSIAAVPPARARRKKGAKGVMIVSGRMRETLQGLVAIAASLALWELLGSATGWGRAVMPAPSRILAQAWADRALYALHGLATIETSALGFMIGVAIAVPAAIGFCRYPALERVFRGVNITLFAMPGIVLGPLLVLFLKGDWPQIVLAAILVYFPVMSATLLGLNGLDPRIRDLVAAYGGGAGALMRHARLRGALPALCAGLRAAAPLAVLGAMLGEFGSGTRRGLGAFLLAALPQGNPPRLWGIGLAASAIALAGFILFLLPARGLAASSTDVTPAAEAHVAAAPESAGRRIALALTAIALPFAIWWLGVTLSHVSPIIAPGPGRTLMLFIAGKEAAAARAALGSALAQTVPTALAGLFVGLAVAFALAALSLLAPMLSRMLAPFALIAQTMPLVAVLPFVVVVFGRGTTASLFTAVLVVFFPAYVLLQQGFTTVPRAANDLVSAYGGGRWTRLVHVAVPSSLGHLFAATRLIAPQALLGVMVAEWLITGSGLGNLLNISRAGLDYDMIWAGAFVSILISVAAHEAVGIVERKVRG